ncbi:hypothetical protein HDU67_003728 [Dinochytrium kinnereticum]|nr:hypothetical protein HDU67_003728 [Dinochytrium kinnereticum]
MENATGLPILPTVDIPFSSDIESLADSDLGFSDSSSATATRINREFASTPHPDADDEDGDDEADGDGDRLARIDSSPRGVGIDNRPRPLTGDAGTDGVAPTKRSASIFSVRNLSPTKEVEGGLWLGPDEGKYRGSGGQVKRPRVGEAGKAEPAGEGEAGCEDVIAVAPAAEEEFPISGHHAISRARGERIKEALQQCPSSSDSDAPQVSAIKGVKTNYTWTPGGRSQGPKSYTNTTVSLGGMGKKLSTRRKSQHTPVNAEHFSKSKQTDYFPKWIDELVQPSLESEMLPVLTGSVPTTAEKDAIAMDLHSSTTAGSEYVFEMPAPVQKVMDVVDGVWQTGVDVTAKTIVTVTMGLVRPPTRLVLQTIDAVSNRVARVSVAMAAAAVWNARGRRF